MHRRKGNRTRRGLEGGGKAETCYQRRSEEHCGEKGCEGAVREAQGGATQGNGNIARRGESLVVYVSRYTEARRKNKFAFRKLNTAVN